MSNAQTRQKSTPPKGRATPRRPRTVEQNNRWATAGWIGVGLCRQAAAMSGTEIVCPWCGTDEHLHGRPGDGVIHLTCTACDLTWECITTPHCPTCGSLDIACVPEVLVERSRGTRLSITGV